MRNIVPDTLHGTTLRQRRRMHQALDRLEESTSPPTEEEWAIDAQMSERAERDAKRSHHSRCKSCGHAAYAHVMMRDSDGVEHSTAPAGQGDCTCGCVVFVERIKNPLAGREWIVQCEFFCKNRWIKGEARVRAMGQVGAIAKGLHEVKKDVIKPRSRVAQIKVTLIPISKKKETK